MSPANVNDVLILLALVHQRQPTMQDILQRTGWSLSKCKRVVLSARSLRCDIQHVRASDLHYYQLIASPLINTDEAIKLTRSKKWRIDNRKLALRWQ